MFPVRQDLHGVFLVSPGLRTVQVLEVHFSVRDASIPEIPFDAPEGHGAEFPAQDTHHEGLRRVHLLLRRPRGGVSDPDHALVPRLRRRPDHGRHHRRLPHIIRSVAVLHEMLRDHHREDVHLLLELRRVDVAAHDDGLVGLREGYLGESHQEGGIQHVGIIDGDTVQVEDRIAVAVQEPAARAGADAAPPQEAGVQTVGSPGIRGLSPAHEGEIGKPLGGVILDHIIGHSAAERPPLDLVIRRQGRKCLRGWHNS